jgi:hypothetical protein
MCAGIYITPTVCIYIYIYIYKGRIDINIYTDSVHAHNCTILDSSHGAI